MKSLVAIFLLFGLSACHSGWDKDPLKGQEENVKNAVPPGTLKPTQPPLKDVVFIDTDDFYDFKVGQEKSITFTYRIAYPGLVVLDLDIPELDEVLPGAVFDPSSNRLTWTPSLDFVAGNQFIRRVPIDLVLYLDNAGVVQEHRQKIAINVLKNSLVAPEVIRVESLPTSIKEGQTARFKVLVRDTDANLQQRPTLTVEGTESGKFNGSDLVSLFMTNAVQDPSNPDLWRFELKLDLTAKELTNYSQDKSFSVRAISAAGIPSMARKENFRVLTQIVRPVFFFQNEVTFYRGEENNYSFAVVDPLGEGRVAAEWRTSCAALTPAARCRCQTQAISSQAQCFIRWKPAFTGSKTLTLRATNTISQPLLQESIPTDGTFTIRVVN